MRALAGMLSQSQIVRYFDRCNDDNSVYEVLSIYVLCKFLNGPDCSHVLRKMHYLACFLRVTGRSHILRIGENAFKAISFEVARGGERIGQTPAATKPGIELSNIIHRKASKKKYPVITDRTYGGPGTIPSFLSDQQLAHLRALTENTHRPAWMEQYFSARCGVLDAIAFSMPEYDSRRDTLRMQVRTICLCRTSGSICSNSIRCSDPHDQRTVALLVSKALRRKKRTPGRMPRGPRERVVLACLVGVVVSSIRPTFPSPCCQHCAVWSHLSPATMDATQDAVNDIFSLSDDVLADKLTFIEEIGNGNWGSVWRCKPKADPTAATAEDFDKVLRPHIAVKVVHRESKSKTSVARVKSLWNEMKIIRTFKNDPHPSIIPFYSFIITPSFALITMALLPTLVPVEVEESAARGWFRYLLSGVEFLHKRGIVHNDIKPANILISEKNIPVLVDFGFAEKYDLSSDTAFHSKVAYGTPEYLSPERAREMPHDTRKSDVWSLGVTFFEILAGRTPFEKSDQEQFTTKEDLEEYWARTLRGQWIGNWKMSRGMEKLLRRMIAPNADLRCTISHAMKDAYWTAVRETESQHRRSASHTSTIVFEKDLSKLIDYESTPTRPRSVRGKENVNTPPGLFSPKTRHEDPLGHHFIGRSKSQPKLEAPKAPEVHPRKRIPAPPLSDLSPIKASPPVSPAATPIAKTTLNARTNVKNRQPLGAQTRNNLPERRANGKDMHSKKDKNARTPPSPSKDEKENHVNQRVKDWEKLREISRMDDTEDETDLGEDAGRASSSSSPEDDDSDTEEGGGDRRDHALPPVPTQSVLPETPARTTPAYIPALPTFSPITLRKQPSSQEFGKASATGGPSSFSPRSMSKRSSASGLNGLKQGIRQSIDKTLQLYKSSLQGHKKAHSLSVDLNDQSQAVDSWMGNPSYLNASTPALGEAPRDPQAADRISLWMKNVEKVVDDARQGFAPSPPPAEEVENPPLSPPARLSSSQRSRSYRSSRLPRRLLAANQIFGDDTERGLSPNSSHVTSGLETGAATSRQNSSSRTSLSDERTESLSTGSKDPSSKRTEKSRSRADVLGMRISPDIAAKRSGSSNSKNSSPKPSPPLDRRMFIATPQRSDESIRGGAITPMSKSFDELTSSPLHVEPYPQRQLKGNIPLPDTPNQRRLEGVYDRFLMATSGVKRLGKGYQSENNGPVYHTVQGHGVERKKSAFASMRRSQLPPPVSSDDPPPKGAMSVDELGMMTYSVAPPSTTSSGKDDSNATVARMRRAIKAIVPGRAVASRRMSSRVPA